MFQKSANRRHSFDQLVGVRDKVRRDLHAETQKSIRNGALGCLVLHRPTREARLTLLRRPTRA